MNKARFESLIDSFRQGANRAVGRMRRAAAGMWRTHKQRKAWERSLMGLVAVGLCVGAAFALLANRTGVPEVPIAFETPAGQSSAESPGGLSAPAGNPAGEPGASEVAVLPPPAVSGGQSGPANTTPVEQPSGASGQPAGTAENAPQGAPQAGSQADSGSPAGAGATQAAGGSGSPGVRLDLPAVSVSDMSWPVAGGMLRPYGWYRHPVFGDWRHASSVVLQPAADQKEVVAALAGRVVDVVDAGGLWRVTIRHAGGWETEYEGLASVDVASYEVVGTGQVIGRAPEGPGGVVAFAVYRDGAAVNPQELLGEPAAAASAP